MENRAYYMTIAIQQWLICRLDILGNLLVLGICLFASGFRKTVNPSDIGVVLSYTLSSTCSISQLSKIRVIDRDCLQLPRRSVSIPSHQLDADPQG